MLKIPFPSSFTSSSFVLPSWQTFSPKRMRVGALVWGMDMGFDLEDILLFALHIGMYPHIALIIVNALI